MNGDSIRFDMEESLIDGQHRLLAVVKSGASVEMSIIEGLSEDAFTTIDSGRMVRGAADFLSIGGEKNANALAAAILAYYRFSVDTPLDSRKVPVKTIVDTLAMNPGIRSGAKFLNSGGNAKKILRPANVLLFHYMFSLIEKERADEFFSALDTGVTKNGVRNAVTVLREKLLKIKMSGQTRVTLSKRFEFGMVIKAWNAYVSGRTPNSFRVDNSKDAALPIIQKTVLI